MSVIHTRRDNGGAYSNMYPKGFQIQKKMNVIYIFRKQQLPSTKNKLWTFGSLSKTEQDKPKNNLSTLTSMGATVKMTLR